MLLVGVFITTTILIPQLGKMTDQREVEHTKLIALQSCYYSAVKIGEADEKIAQIFCNKYSEDLAGTYRDITIQMNKIIDDQYQIVPF